MGKRPSFQFYPADWRANANLRRCSPSARGAWMDILGVLHDSDEYGLVRWPLKELAQAAGVVYGLARELAAKSVLKGSDARLTESYVYTPRSGRKDGEPVTLVPAQDGPIWFSSRMVRDEYVRTVRGNTDTKDEAPKASPKIPIGADIGPRTPARSSSTSSSTSQDQKEVGGRARDPDDLPPSLDRVQPVLNRICEILRIRLEGDPDRITWRRQVEEMLRDSIPEADIIAGAEVARTNAVPKLSYIRTVAMKIRNTKEINVNGRSKRESVQETWLRAASELAAESEAGNGAGNHHAHYGAGVTILAEGHADRGAESLVAADVRRLSGKV